MAEERITTESVAAGAVETDPIVLKQTDERRLVFQAMLVDKPEAPVRGHFVWQRKRKADEWEDLRGETLNSLKAGEGYRLTLRSAEVAALLQGIQDRKEIYEKHGIQFGQQDYYSGEHLPDVVKQILEEPESELAEALRNLEPDALMSLGQTVDRSKLDAFLDEWETNSDNDSEEYWQDLFTRHPWVLSHLTASPVVLLEDKAYVGGKGVSNKGGGVVDYLVTNALTDNVSLIEIKTPQSQLIEGEYRSGIYPPATEVAGGVVQVLGYRNSFLSEINALRKDDEDFHAYNPIGYLLVGTTESLGSEQAKRSFELFRNEQAGVRVITFDEARARLEGIRDVLVADDSEHEDGDTSAVTEAEPVDWETWEEPL